MDEKPTSSIPLRWAAAALALVTAGILAAIVGGTSPITGGAIEATGTAQRAQISVPATACDDDDVAGQVERALALGNETEANALLALPQDVPSADQSRQADAWQALSADELAYQLCLHLRQEGIS